MQVKINCFSAVFALIFVMAILYKFMYEYVYIPLAHRDQ